MGWFLFRIVIAATIFATIFLFQRFWYRAIWRASAGWSAVWPRVAVRLLYVLGALSVVAAIVDGLRVGQRGHLIPRDAMLAILSGLWVSGALFAFLAVKIVHVVDRLWSWGRTQLRAKAVADPASRARPRPCPIGGSVGTVARPIAPLSFRAASVLAGAAPFAAVYGFTAERLNYKVRRIEIPSPTCRLLSTA